jgi:hypothetical protein
MPVSRAGCLHRFCRRRSCRLFSAKRQRNVRTRRFSHQNVKPLYLPPSWLVDASIDSFKATYDHTRQGVLAHQAYGPIAHGHDILLDPFPRIHGANLLCHMTASLELPDLGTALRLKLGAWQSSASCVTHKEVTCDHQRTMPSVGLLDSAEPRTTALPEASTRTYMCMNLARMHHVRIGWRSRRMLLVGCRLEESRPQSGRAELQGYFWTLAP